MDKFIGYQPDHFPRKIVPLTNGIEEISLRKFETCHKTEKKLNRTIKCISCDEIECPNNGNIELQSEVRHQREDGLASRRGILRRQLSTLGKKMSFNEFLELTAEFQDVIEKYWESLRTCPHCGKFI